MTKQQDSENQTTAPAAALVPGELLARLSHDLRTSANGVAGMLALLLDAGLPPAHQQLAAAALRCADDLLSLTEGAVDLLLIGAGRLELGRDRFDLLPLLHAACAAPAAAARVKGLDMQLHFPPAQPLLGDARRLQQIVGALVDSAVGLAAHGPIRVDARVTDSGCGRRLRATVSAEAIDVAGRQVLHILNQSGMAAMAPAPECGRIALQLALCRQLAMLMDARVGADERPGQASRLWFEVELEAAESEANGTDAARLTPAVPDALAASAGRRILVVDDHPVNREVALRMLEKLGCRVEAAAGGWQAVAMHCAQPYELILMDCEMPDLDGYHATERIRALEGAARRTPIVALTACAAPGDRDKCLAAGMDDYISKPVKRQTLEQALGRWLARPAPEQDACSSHDDELEMVRGMFGADFAELTALYRNDSPPRIAALREAAAAEDYPRLAKVAHAFGGSSMSIGATALATMCKDLELRAKQNALDDFAQRMAAIEAEYSRVSHRLQALCRVDVETA